MSKPTKWVCAQRRLRSAWASAQSDQSLRCPHEETLDLKLPSERTAKTLIRLGGCPGWSEFSLGAKVILLVLSWGGSSVLWHKWQSEQSTSDQGIHCLLTQISIKNKKWKCTPDTPKIGNVLVQLKWNISLGKYGLIPQKLQHSAHRWSTHTETWCQIHKVPYCIRLWNRDLQAWS